MPKLNDHDIKNKNEMSYFKQCKEKKRGTHPCIYIHTQC